MIKSLRENRDKGDRLKRSISTPRCQTAQTPSQGMKIPKRKRRKIKTPPQLGDEIVWLKARGLWRSWVAVDTSRLEEGLIGVKKRREWGHCKDIHIPPYEKNVIFIEIHRFWDPHPIFRARRSRIELPSEKNS